MLSTIMRFLVFLLAMCAVSCTLRPSNIPAVTGHGSAIVFDIDGTLTPDIFSIYTVRQGAVDVAQHYADHGYAIIYLSARFRWLQSGIPEWLDENGFPVGYIHVPQSLSVRMDTVSFKSKILDDYQKKGWHLFAAYGDSSSDFEAYNRADIAPSAIFALQRSGEDYCQPGIWAACLPSWPSHLATIHLVLNQRL